jgi:ABC-type multidrug transport system ATPase subunit
LWRIIEKAKHNRVVIMITHSMEESEALGDVIGIMTDGKLKVLGTSLHLKNKLGAGYSVIAAVPDRTAAEHVGTIIAESCPGSKTQSIISASNTVGKNGDQSVIAEYELPRHMSDEQMTRFVTMLEEKQVALGISRFSVNQSTLEDVFKRITTLSHETEEELENRKWWQRSMIYRLISRRRQG